MLIYLHGYKSEYVSPDLIKDQIPEGLIEYSNEFTFNLACPLCPFRFYWRTTFVFSFVKHLIEKYRVNESMIFLSGTSMGLMEPGPQHMNFQIVLQQLLQYMEEFMR